MTDAAIQAREKKVTHNRRMQHILYKPNLIASVFEIKALTISVPGVHTGFRFGEVGGGGTMKYIVDSTPSLGGSADVDFDRILDILKQKTRCILL